ncbi:MAG: PD40 domain-containing protein [Chloroflexi bacterium]|mgnify:CR=1 FL=1|nr:PD40 domain-containing protein [Chloroflexota bacterium]
MRVLIIAVVILLTTTSCGIVQGGVPASPFLSPSATYTGVVDIPSVSTVAPCGDISPLEKIAIRSFSDENYISIINVDGSYYAEHVVTGSTFSWSPDGTSLAFTSGKNGDLEIFRIDIDGNNQRQLTNSIGEDSGPVWSPDGTLIAFASMMDGNFQIWTMNSANGANLKRLTNSPEPTPYVIAWLPRLRRIIFARVFTSGPILYSMDEDGSNQRQLELANLPSGVIDISWSPDEQRIAFSSQADGTYEIFTMNSDGSDMTRLTNNTSNNYSPAWSPDGCFIAFHSDRDGHSEIYLMNADGVNQTRLTHGSDNNFSPKFQP